MSDVLDSKDSRKRRHLSDPESNESQPQRIDEMKGDGLLKELQTQLEESSTVGVKVAVNKKLTFKSLGLDKWQISSLENMAITNPTPIQAECIPEILKGRDCIGGSRTGSGKTIAFAAPMLHQWAKDPSGIFAVVMTPTRSVKI